MSALTGCADSGNSSAAMALPLADSTYSASGTVSGLTRSGLVLAVNGTSVTVASGATTTALASGLASGAAYTVTVQTQPVGESCSVVNGTGRIAAANVSNVTVNCHPSTVTVSGTVTGLGTGTGLVLLNNGADATSVSANATTFTMQTAVAYGASYNITIGTQPYGIRLGCRATWGSGTAYGNVMSVAVNCAPVTPTQKNLVTYFTDLSAVAVDSSGNLFVADENTALWKIPFANGSYGTPIAIASGFQRVAGVALDAKGDVFFTDAGAGLVEELPLNAGSYGTPQSIGGPGFSQPSGIAVDSNGNVFVADPSNRLVKEIPYTQGSYGTAIQIGGSNFSTPWAVAVGADGNVFVADETAHAVSLIAWNGTAYSTSAATINTGSATIYPVGVAVDASGNLFVSTNSEGATPGPGGVIEFAFNGGAYGSPQTVASGLYPWNLTVDAQGDVFVADQEGEAVREIPFTAGTGYGAPVAIISDYVGYPNALAVDGVGDLFLVNDALTLQENLVENGVYPAPPVTAGGSLADLNTVAADASGNLFVSGGNPEVVYKIPLQSGSYGTPVVIGTGFTAPNGLAIDMNDDVFVLDLATHTIQEISCGDGTGAAVKVSCGSGFYDAPVTLATLASTPQSLAVDGSGNVFVADGGSTVTEIPFTNGQYGAPRAYGPTFGAAQSVAADKLGDVFLIDASNETVTMIPAGNGTPVKVGSGYYGAYLLSIDARGRVYVVDSSDIWEIAP